MSRYFCNVICSLKLDLRDPKNVALKAVKSSSVTFFNLVGIKDYSK